MRLGESEKNYKLKKPQKKSFFFQIMKFEKHFLYRNQFFESKNFKDLSKNFHTVKG